MSAAKNGKPTRHTRQSIAARLKEASRDLYALWRQNEDLEDLRLAADLAFQLAGAIDVRGDERARGRNICGDTRVPSTRRLIAAVEALMHPDMRPGARWWLSAAERAPLLAEQDKRVANGWPGATSADDEVSS